MNYIFVSEHLEKKKPFRKIVARGCHAAGVFHSLMLVGDGITHTVKTPNNCGCQDAPGLGERRHSFKTHLV